MDELVAALCANLPPAPRRFTERRLLLGALLGLIGVAVLWLLVAEPRENLVYAVASGPFWMKVFYIAALAASSFWMMMRAGKPGAAMTPPLLALLAAAGLIGLHAGATMTAPLTDIASLVMGQSAARCIFTILLLSLPALAACFWALRCLAPTRLAQAGAGAGVFAGSEGAMLYIFSCTEDAALFVAVWYTIGILLTATLGAFLGRLLLRW